MCALFGISKCNLVCYSTFLHLIIYLLCLPLRSWILKVLDFLLVERLGLTWYFCWCAVDLSIYSWPSSLLRTLDTLKTYQPEYINHRAVILEQDEWPLVICLGDEGP